MVPGKLVELVKWSTGSGLLELGGSGAPRDWLQSHCHQEHPPLLRSTGRHPLLRHCPRGPWTSLGLRSPQHETSSFCSNSISTKEGLRLPGLGLFAFLGSSVGHGLCLHQEPSHGPLPGVPPSACTLEQG